MWDKWLLVRCAKLLQAKYKVKQKKVWGCRATKQAEEEVKKN